MKNYLYHILQKPKLDNPYKKIDLPVQYIQYGPMSYIRTTYLSFMTRKFPNISFEIRSKVRDKIGKYKFTL
jgi:hypothetical protein